MTKNPPDLPATRTPNGQFAKGNPGGPGRPPRPVENDYLRRLNEVVTLDRWRRIVERAVVDAENGDAPARTWLSKYLLGEWVSFSSFLPHRLAKLPDSDSHLPDFDGLSPDLSLELATEVIQGCMTPQDEA